MAGMSKIKEEWKYIEGSKDCYVSNLGRLKRSDGSIIKQHKHSKGYMMCCVPGVKEKFVHRIVAKTFITNDDPDNKVVVNHLNSKKDDNRVINLEWCTHKENAAHAVKSGNVAMGGAKKSVIGIDTKSDEVKIFESSRAASRYIGGDAYGRGVAEALKGKLNSYYGWKFYYISKEAMKELAIEINYILKTA